MRRSRRRNEVPTAQRGSRPRPERRGTCPRGRAVCSPARPAPHLHGRGARGRTGCSEEQPPLLPGRNANYPPLGRNDCAVDADDQAFMVVRGPLRRMSSRRLGGHEGPAVLSYPDPELPASTADDLGGLGRDLELDLFRANAHRRGAATSHARVRRSGRFLTIGGSSSFGSCTRRSPFFGIKHGYWEVTPLSRAICRNLDPPNREHQ